MKKRIYIYESGTLARQDNSLVFIREKDKYKFYLPIYQIELISIYGHCVFNKDLVQILFENNISILMFTFNGRYLGCFSPKRNCLGDILIKQVTIVTDFERKNIYAKEIINSSICNMLSVLKYYNKKGRNLDEYINNIQLLQNKFIDQDLKNFSLIYEAKIKMIYYSSFNEIIKNNYFCFKRRTTNPPEDPINALMSYGYAVLYGILENDIHLSNLNISLPFIHGVTRNPGGLQYDIADIFKPVIIDRLIFRMINKRQIDSSYFIYNKDSILLSKQGTRLFLEEFENQLSTTISVNNKKISYRSLLKKEVYKIELSIKNDKKYIGYKMKW